MAKKKLFKHKVFGELHVLVLEDGKVLYLASDIRRILDVDAVALLTACCYIGGTIFDYLLTATGGKKAGFSFMDERLVKELTDCPAWENSEQRKWLLETVTAEAKKETTK